MYGPSKASYGYTVCGWGLQGVYKGLQGVYKGYLDYLHLKLLLMYERAYGRGRARAGRTGQGCLMGCLIEDTGGSTLPEYTSLMLQAI